MGIELREHVDLVVGLMLGSKLGNRDVDLVDGDTLLGECVRLIVGSLAGLALGSGDGT